MSDNNTQNPAIAQNPDTIQNHDSDNNLRWPEGLALTLALVLFALAASGKIDGMLPWTQ